MAVSRPHDIVKLTVMDPASPDVSVTIDTWTQYEFTNGLFTPADSFSFQFAMTRPTGRPLTPEYMSKMRELLRPDTVVRLTIGPDNIPAGTGIIDDVYVHGDRNEIFIDVSGRDGMSLLQDNVASQKLSISGDNTLPTIADQVVAKYREHGLDFIVLTDNESNRNVMTGKTQPLQARFGTVNASTVRLKNGTYPVTKAQAAKIPVSTDFFKMPFDEARPHLGEYEYDFLDRHARNVGVMMWMDVEGSLIFSQPNYSQDTLFRFFRVVSGLATGVNNILSGGARRNTANSATSVKVIGHAEGRKENRTQVTHTESLDPEIFQAVLRNGQALSTVFSKDYAKTIDGLIATLKKKTEGKVTTFGESYSWPRAKIVHDAHARTKERAQHVARRVLSRSNANLLTLEYEVQGYEQNGNVYAPDTIAYVNDEVAGVEGDFYIIERTLRKSRQSETTHLKLVPVGAIVL